MENQLILGLSLVFTFVGMFIQHRMETFEKHYSILVDRAIQGIASIDELNYILYHRRTITGKHRLTLEQYAKFRYTLERTKNYNPKGEL